MLLNMLIIFNDYDDDNDDDDNNDDNDNDSNDKTVISKE